MTKRLKQRERFYPLSLLAGLMLSSLLLWAAPATAQIIPDTTLPSNSTVTSIPDSNELLIGGGTPVGNNLFHSFQEFSVPLDITAQFDNVAEVSTIISRVTGADPSSIEGTLATNGTADLLFLNPNGIVFGDQASLNIAGSFVATTAESVEFPNGVTFDADGSSSPLLEVTTPIGLQFGPNPAPISVKGQTSNFVFNRFVPATRNTTQGLSVGEGETLALLGGSVNLDSGLLTAPSGDIQLAAIESGTVEVSRLGNQQGNQLKFNYDSVEAFGDVQLANFSLLDGSGTDAGSIELIGETIQLSDSSVLFIQHKGVEQDPLITVRATESINFTGFDDDVADNGSGIITENLGDGPGGSYVISAPKVSLQNGSAVLGFSFAAGSGADINLFASDTIELLNGIRRVVTPTQPFPVEQTAIGSNALGAGNSGDVNVETKQLVIQDGGAFGSQTLGSGDAGDLTITADVIEMSGVIPDTGFLSTLGSITSGSGDAGVLTVNTRQLSVLDGAAIISRAVGTGQGGDVIINGSELVQVSGRSSDIFALPSQIATAEEDVPEPVRELFDIPERLPTESRVGSVVVNTPLLLVNEGASISVSNEGVGNAGILDIDGVSVILDDGGQLIAFTAAGTGGNIDIDLENSLLLFDGSSISASAQGTGEGGNVVIDAKVVLAPPGADSDITAEALDGPGGQIIINAEGVFGFNVVEQPDLGEIFGILSTDDNGSNDISAISQASAKLSGEVIINTPNLEPGEESIEPAEPISTEGLIATTCQPGQDQSTFLLTGRGGVATTPSEPQAVRGVWLDLRTLDTVDSTMVAEPTNAEAIHEIALVAVDCRES